MQAQRILEGLDEAQRTAVEHVGGPLLIVAGAGTGKTRVVTSRVALLVERGCAPERILAITFTNKAAREMRERVAHWLPGTKPWVYTFHALAARILRQDGEAIGIPRDYAIVDRDDQLALLRRLAKEAGIQDKRVRPGAVLERILGWKLAGSRPEEHSTFAALEPIEDAAHRLFAPYVESLRVAHLLDFDDLLLQAERLLAHPMAGAPWRERFHHVLVDEFQDTNALQGRMVAHFAHHAEIAVCGDPDQSIYSWRGATVENILAFQSTYPDTTLVRLESNYRSTGPILEAASALIARNQHRIERDLRPNVPRPGPQPSYSPSLGEVDEANDVISRIAALVHEEGIRPGEIAILFRTHALTRPFEAGLRSAGLPYRLVGAVAFYARREIKDLLAYLRLRVHPFDTEAFARAVGVPARGVGAKSQAALIARAAELSCSVVEVILDSSRWPRLRGRSARGVQEFAELLSRWFQEPGDDLTAVLRALVEQLDYESYLHSLDDGIDRMENVRALLADAHDYQSRNPYAQLSDYLEQRALVQDTDALADGVSGEVNLMTLHSAKGLEFRAVFLCGVEEGILPHRRSWDEPGGIEEERRLFYVGLTRARERLSLTSSSYRVQFGRTEPSAPSRFLTEIPEELLERPGGRPEPWAASVEGEVTLEFDGEFDAEWEPGDDVLHESFGAGRILEVWGYGPRTRLRVRFASGERVLSASYARLRKVRSHEY